MKTITGSVVSSKPISLSKAASTLSSFLSADNGASQALCAYLRRASASFNELKQLHKELKPSRSEPKNRNHILEVSNDLEATVDNPYLIEDIKKKNSSVTESKSGKKQRENRNRTQDEKTVMASGGNGNFEDVVDEDKPSGRVEMDVESIDRDKSDVAVEKKRKKHKKKSEDAYGKIGDDNNGEIETAGDFVENNVSRGKDRKRHEVQKSLGDENNQVKIEGQSTDLVELSTKKKKKKKKQDADDLQVNGERAIVKEEIPVSDSKDSKRKERKKRKSRDLEEEGGDDGSEEQQGTKRRKGNL